MENPTSNTFLLPMWSVYEDDDDLSRSVDCVIHADALNCHHLPPDEECDGSGIMYSSWSPSGGQSRDMQCARDWYDNHARCGGKYRIEDMTMEEYDKQCKVFDRYRRRMLKEANSEIHAAAVRLADLGFREEADRFFGVTTPIMIRCSGTPDD